MQCCTSRSMQSYVHVGDALKGCVCVCVLMAHLYPLGQCLTLGITKGDRGHGLRQASMHDSSGITQPFTHPVSKLQTGVSDSGQLSRAHTLLAPSQHHVSGSLRAPWLVWQQLLTMPPTLPAVVCRQRGMQPAITHATCCRFCTGEVRAGAGPPETAAAKW